MDPREIDKVLKPDEAISDLGWAPVADLLVTEERAAEILWRSDKRVHLKPFLGRESSLAEAAVELSIKKTAMSYWIDRLLEAGLIRRSRILRQGRNRIPYYRCVADQLRVGLEHAPFESLEHVLSEFSLRFRRDSEASLVRALSRQAHALELSFVQPDAAGIRSGVLTKTGVKIKDDFLYNWARLWLSDKHQDELKREMEVLWDKYEALSNQDQHKKTTLMHLMLVPEKG